MRILGSAVLAMEALIMGFALLLAKNDSTDAQILIGAILAILLLLAPALLKKKSGWIIGSVLQVAIVAYSFVVPSLIIVGVIFVALWIAAIVVGRKGEAFRAALLAEEAKAQQQ